METSGEGGPEDKLAVVAASDHGERAALAVYGEGEGERTLLDSLDYPCTARLRWRRLLAYLREYSCGQIYDVAKDKLGVIFHVEDLVALVKAGKLQEAYHYVRNFATIKQSSNEAELLAGFLEYLMAISRFADGHTIAGNIVCNWFKSLYMHPVLRKFPCFATIVADVLFLRAHHVRTSLDWQLIRNKAAEIVEKIAYTAPDLKDRMRYPHGQNRLYDVMPIRCSLRQRRQVKNIGQKQATDLAQFYLQMKRRLPSSGQPGFHDYSGSARNQGGVLVALFEIVFQAGKRMVLKQGPSPEHLFREAMHVYKSIPDCIFREQGHQPEHKSNQGKALQAGKRVVLEQGCPPEHLSKGVFPLEAMHAYKPIPYHIIRAEHTSNQAMNNLRLQESCLYTVHQGNALKRPRTTGSFCEGAEASASSGAEEGATEVVGL